MKRLMRGLLAMTLLPLLFGCSAGGALLGASVGVAGWQGYRIVSTPDVTGLAKTGIEVAEERAVAVLESMDILLTDREQKDKGEILIKAKSPRYKNIKVRLSSFSNKRTEVNVTVREKWYSSQIMGGSNFNLASEICEKIEKGGAAIATSSPAPASATNNPDAVTGVTIQISNVRAGPGVNYEIVAVAPKNSKLIFLDESGNWIKVKILETGRVGYIYNTLVRPDG